MPDGDVIRSCHQAWKSRSGLCHDRISALGWSRRYLCAEDLSIRLMSSRLLRSIVGHSRYLVIVHRTTYHLLNLMFSRLSQLARHFSKPLPNYAHRSAAALSSQIRMTSPSQPSAARQIHTAGCIIIGDEVLGGKV